MVLHNPNNWHWVNKDTSAWARTYLEKELIGISAEKDGVSARIDKVLSMEGDVDVSQRKGKVITLFDVKLQLEYSGKAKAKDGEEENEQTSGTITVPEVAHDTEEDEYVFEIDIYNDSASKQPVKDLVRSAITPQLRSKLAALGPALIAAHGAGLQHATTTTTSSSNGTSTASKVSSSSSVSKPTTSSSTNPIPASKINTTTVTTTSEFRTTASELYTTFTSAERLTAFTRQPPSEFSPTGHATPDAPFAIFGGNVSGTYKTLEPPTRLVQTWRLAQWPSGHFSELELAFDQNDVDKVTVLRVEWRGVPVGQEEVVRRNWDGYYVRGIKSAFGFGTIL